MWCFLGEITVASLDHRYLGEWLFPFFHVHIGQVVKGHLTGFSTVKILDFLLGMKEDFVEISSEMIAYLSLTVTVHSLLPQSMMRRVLPNISVSSAFLG